MAQQMQQRGPRGGGFGPARERSEFIEKVVQIDRVSRVQKGGRRFRFRATVVLGDGAGRVGVGIGKGGEVITAIAKAVEMAKKKMVTIPLEGGTIPHDVTVKFAGAVVMLRPASEGTGVIAGGAVRAVVEAAGVKDILSKSMGSSNKLNNVQAAMLALQSLTPRPSRAKSKAAAKPVEPVAVATDLTADLPADNAPSSGGMVQTSDEQPNQPTRGGSPRARKTAHSSLSEEAQASESKTGPEAGTPGKGVVS
jgi:small subunit ribosomal protein S5